MPMDDFTSFFRSEYIAHPIYLETSQRYIFKNTLRGTEDRNQTVRKYSMKQPTEQNLINAFGAESMVHMRYLHFAVQADKENYSNTARLFRAVSHAEHIHAVDHYQLLRHLETNIAANSMGAFGSGRTLKNLRLAILGETFEVIEMYPAYMGVAKVQEEMDAYRSFEWAYKSEQMHKSLFEKAKSCIETGKDVELGPIQVCEVCGYTLEGKAPDPCPVCGAEQAEFTPFA